MPWTIYTVRNTINDKLYVGQTVKTVSARWKQHVADTKTAGWVSKLGRAVRKYGPAARREKRNADPVKRQAYLEYLRIYRKRRVNA
jgi:hypothetical protein